MGGGHANSALSALDKHIACILGHTALGGDDQEADTVVQRSMVCWLYLPKQPLEA